MITFEPYASRPNEWAFFDDGVQLFNINFTADYKNQSRTCRMFERLPDIIFCFTQLRECSPHENTWHSIMKIIDNHIKYINHGKIDIVIKVLGEKVTIPNSDSGLDILKRLQSVIELKKANNQ